MEWENENVLHAYEQMTIRWKWDYFCIVSCVRTMAYCKLSITQLLPTYVLA